MIELCWLEANHQREADPYSGTHCWSWLEVSYMEATVKTYLLEQFGYCCQKAEEIGSWECQSTGWPRKCLTIVLALVQH